LKESLRILGKYRTHLAKPGGDRRMIMEDFWRKRQEVQT
jgi:hypothetical protein